MSELGDKLRKLRQKYIDGGGRLYSAAEINADLRGLEQPPEATTAMTGAGRPWQEPAEGVLTTVEQHLAPEAAPRDIAQELIAGLEEVRDMRKCKKCEYPNCFCVQPQPQKGSS